MEDEQPMEDIMTTVNHELLRNGIKEKIFEELQQEIDVHCISENEDTVLHSILRNPKLIQKDVVEFLTICLDQGVDPNNRNASGETALHLAIERRMQKAVCLLLESKANRYVVDPSGNRIAHFFIEDEYEKMKTASFYPLMNTPENREIAENSSVDFASLLLVLGVNFDLENKEGKSALDLAIMYNQSHLIPVLLHRNFRPNISPKSIPHSDREISIRNWINHPGPSRILVSNAIEIKVMCLLDVLREIAKISDELELKNGQNPFDFIAEQLKCKNKSNFEIQKDIVKFLTCCLAEIDDQNDRSRHGEIKRKIKEAVSCLLEHAAKIQVVDQLGNGISHFSIVDEYEKVKVAMSGPLMNPSENREKLENFSCDIVSFLIGIGVDFDHKNEEDKSALHLTIMYNLPHLLAILLESTYVKPNYEELIEILLTEISSTSRSHLPDESHTDISNYDTILLMFLDKGNFDNNYGLTFLSTAIKNKREMSCIQTMINYFLIKCDDLNFATDIFEELTSTCAYWSDSDRDYFSTVLFDLISRGVNINEVNIRKRLVWRAIASKNTWLLDFLQQMGMTFMGLELKNDENLIRTIAEQMDYTDESSLEFCQKLVDMLVSSGYDLNSQDRYGKTALQTAIDSGKVPMVRMIIESGVDLNCRDKCGRTALHHAMLIDKLGISMMKPPMNQFRPDRFGFPRDVEFNHYSRSTDFHAMTEMREARMIVELLVKAGVDVNARDLMFNTPLHIAVFHDDYEMMELLLEGNVDVNAKDREGDTPLQLILVLRDQLYYSYRMMTLLLRKGACTNVRNMQMETPLELALMYQTKLAIELLSYNADLEDSNVRQLLRDLNDWQIDPKVRHYYNQVGTLLCIQRHWIKLMAANLPVCSEFRNYMTGRVDRKYYEQCLAEIDELKKVWIDDQLSLYDYLHMHPRGRCAYMQRENVQQIINSPNLIYKFPEISVLVMASYQEAKVFHKRETISVILGQIFFRMSNVSYPSIAEKIVNFLREDDLFF